MQNRRVTATVLTAAFAALTLIAGCERKSDPLLIGHLATLTGPDRGRGEQAVRGVQLAVEKVNADPQQWVGGRKVAVLHADTRGEADAAGDQAVRLATLNKVVALIGGPSRAQAEAAIPACREYSLVFVNAAGVRGTPPAENAFALGLSTSERAKSIANYLNSVRKAESATLVCDERDPAMVAFAEAFRPAFGKPITVVSEVKNAAGPVVIAARASTAIAIARQLPAPRDLYSAVDDTGMVELAAAGSAVEGVTTASSFALDESTAFARAFAAKFGVPADADALASYEAARILFAAARDAKTFAWKTLRPKFAALKDFAGVHGPISIGPDGGAVGPSFLLQLTEGHWKPIRRVEPEAAVPATKS